jgi:hypothetical protein
LVLTIAHKIVEIDVNDPMKRPRIPNRVIHW